MRIVFFWLLRLFSALAGIACFLIGAASFHSERYWTFALSWFCSGLLSGLFTFADDQLTRARVTWSAEISAADLARIISSESEFGYGLVLRPFEMDAQIRMQNNFNPFPAVGIGFGMPIIDVQEWVIRSSPRNWRWFSWGGNVGPIRPIKVLSGDNWFDELKPIIMLADVTIIIPGASDSMHQEYDFLLEKRANQAVILFPPRSQNDRFYHGIERSTRFSKFLTGVPDQGCFLLPHQEPSGVRFEKEYLTSRKLKRILEARRHAAKD